MQLKSRHLERRDLQPTQRLVGHIEGQEVHQREISPVLFVTPDAFVVVDEVAAPVEDWLAPVDLDPLGMVG